MTLPQGDAVAVELSSAIHRGDLDALRRMLAGHPELASVRMIGRKGGWRTPLHTATDWPGYFPGAPEAVGLLLEAGADVNDDTGGERPETPLHWAASTDDVDVAVVLIDAGADLERPGGSIGTPLDNAVGYACWHVARLLVARGARVQRLWHAAALGMLERMEQLLAESPVGAAQVSQAFWHACAGGQRRAAEYLLARGAELDWVPDYAAGTPLDAADSLDTRQANVVGWLRDQGAPSSTRRGVDQLLEEARRPMERVDPAAAAAAIEAGAVLVDIRSSSQVARDGLVPGALVIERNVLEWRLDPAGAHRHPRAPGVEQQVILMCNEGYQSSLAAATLRQLGYMRATDLAGGFQAWRAAGLPTTEGPAAGSE